MSRLWTSRELSFRFFALQLVNIHKTFLRGGPTSANIFTPGTLLASTRSLEAKDARFLLKPNLVGLNLTHAQKTRRAREIWCAFSESNRLTSSTSLSVIILDGVASRMTPPATCLARPWKRTARNPVARRSARSPMRRRKKNAVCALRDRTSAIVTAGATTIPTVCCLRIVN